jgi:ABC-type transporter Mla subunit MlaD
MKDAGTEAASITIWHWICSIESRAAGRTKITKQETEKMSIQKKSLIGNLTAAKKAIVAALDSVAFSSAQLSKELPRAAKELPRAAKELPRAAKELPRAAKELPRAAKELPRAAKELPRAAKELPRAAKELPRAAKELPRAAKELPRAAKELAAGGQGTAARSQGNALVHETIRIVLATRMEKRDRVKRSLFFFLG